MAELVGKNVVLFGLRREELNGEVGRVLRYDRNEERCAVKLESSGKTFKVHPANLEEDCSDDDESGTEFGNSDESGNDSDDGSASQSRKPSTGEPAQASAPSKDPPARDWQPPLSSEAAGVFGLTSTQAHPPLTHAFTGAPDAAPSWRGLPGEKRFDVDDEPYSLDEFLSYYGEEYGREVWTSARRVEPEVEGKPPKSPAPPPKAQKEQQLQATTGTDMTMGKTKTESPPSTSESPPPPPAKPQPKRPAREKRQASESSSTVARGPVAGGPVKKQQDATQPGTDTCRGGVSSRVSAAFERFDKGEQGEMPVRDLQPALRALGVWDDACGQTSELLGRFDKAGKLGLVEFARLVDELKEAAVERSRKLDDSAVEAAFTSFDRDGSGGIAARELRAALAALGVDADGEGVKAMLKKFDADGNGSLDLWEFSQLVHALRAAARTEKRRHGRLEIGPQAALDRAIAEASSRALPLAQPPSPISGKEAAQLAAAHARAAAGAAARAGSEPPASPASRSVVYSWRSVHQEAVRAAARLQQRNEAMCQLGGTRQARPARQADGSVVHDPSRMEEGGRVGAKSRLGGETASHRPAPRPNTHRARPALDETAPTGTSTSSSDEQVIQHRPAPDLPADLWETGRTSSGPVAAESDAVRSRGPPTMAGHQCSAPCSSVQLRIKELLAAAAAFNEAAAAVTAEIVTGEEDGGRALPQTGDDRANQGDTSASTRAWFGTLATARSPPRAGSAREEGERFIRALREHVLSRPSTSQPALTGSDAFRDLRKVVADGAARPPHRTTAAQALDALMDQRERVLRLGEGTEPSRWPSISTLRQSERGLADDGRLPEIARLRMENARLRAELEEMASESPVRDTGQLQQLARCSKHSLVDKIAAMQRAVRRVAVPDLGPPPSGSAPVAFSFPPPPTLSRSASQDSRCSSTYF